MRASSPLHLWTAWVCVVAYVLTGFVGAADALVLCVGANGHLAVEAAHDEGPSCECPRDVAAAEPSSEDAPASGQDALQALHLAGERCCIDIPLLTSRPETARHDLRAGRALAPPILKAAPVAALPSATSDPLCTRSRWRWANRLCGDASLASFSLTLLRGVVILV